MTERPPGPQRLRLGFEACPPDSDVCISKKGMKFFRLRSSLRTYI